MTTTSFTVLTATPRKPPTLTPPQLNSALALIWAKAEQKAAKRRKESSNDVELLRKFGGEFPPTIVCLMSGEGLNKDAGFHASALQIGIAANKKDDEVLVLREGLLANHESGGTRDNSPDKHRAEVIRMLRHTDGNVCYTYGKGAIKSLLAPGIPSTDLDGLSAAAGPVTSEAPEIPDDGMLGGVFLTETGC